MRSLLPSKRALQSKVSRALPEEDAPYGRGPKEALDTHWHLAKKLGFKTGNLDNKVGWIEYGDGEEMAAVLGHLDVVPLGEGWKYPPLACEIHDGKMYGRGVLDDKGPVIGANLRTEGNPGSGTADRQKDPCHLWNR